MRIISSSNQLRLGVILNYINLGLGTLIPFFYTPVMLALLGQDEYGLYKLSSSLTGYISLVSLGMGTAVTRYLIKSREEEGIEGEERTFGLFLMIFRIIAILSLIVGAVLIIFVDTWYSSSLSVTQIGRMRILMGILTLNTVLSFRLAPYISVVTANERFIFMQSMNIISTSVIPMANLVALYMGYASIGMAVSSLIIQLIIRLSYYVYSKRSLRLTPRYERVNPERIKEIIIFAFWIFVGEIVGKLYGATDTVLIGAIPALSTSGVAVYHVGTVFSSMMLAIAVGISGLLVPRTNKMVFEGASSSELTVFAIRIGRIQALIVGLVISGFIVFGRPFIHFYVGDLYKESYIVALFIMIPYMIPIVQNVFYNIIVAKNKHRFRSLVYLGIAILNVIGTWFLIHKMGVTGAALMSGLALIIGQGFIMNWFYWKKIGLRIGKFWKSIFPIYALAMLMAVFAGVLGHYFIDLYRIGYLILSIVIFSVTYFLICWISVMNDYERKLIKQIIGIKS